MHKNYFDIVMNYIEENVDKPTEEIKREIPKLIGRNGRAFSESFALLTGYTLDYYIRQRRLLYAVRDVVLKPGKTLAQIALEYQFSDQAAFSRAVKSKYHFTPTEIRDNGVLLSEDPFRLADYTKSEEDPTLQKLIRSMEVENWIEEDIDLMMQIDELNKDFGLEWDTCCMILNLAERLDVPYDYLFDACTTAMMDAHSAGEYFVSEMAEIEYEIWLQEMGIESEEELKAICEFFHTKYLDEYMVARYREEQAKRSKEE